MARSRKVPGWLPWLGVAAPLVYATAVIYGAAARPDYSHIADPISKLIEAGAPNKPAIDGLFILYNCLVIAFAAGLPRRFATGGRACKAGALALGLTGCLGLIMTFFPMDAIGTPATGPGITHIVLAGLESLATMAAVLAFALAFGQAGRRGMAAYSWLTLAATLVPGGIAAWSAASAGPLMGLWERITIGSVLVWILVVAVTLTGSRSASLVSDARAITKRP
jgi:hypothetical protein